SKLRTATTGRYGRTRFPGCSVLFQVLTVGQKRFGCPAVVLLQQGDGCCSVALERGLSDGLVFGSMIARPIDGFEEQVPIPERALGEHLTKADQPPQVARAVERLV